MIQRTEQLQFNVDGREAVLVRVESHPGPTRHLTESEHTVAALLLEGRTYKDIAAKRNTSIHTVANQTRSVYHTFGIHSRRQLSARLVEHKRGQVATYIAQGRCHKAVSYELGIATVGARASRARRGREEAT